MRLAIRSLVVLLAGCAIAAGGYFALGSLPVNALGGLAGGPDGHRGRPPGSATGIPGAAGAANADGVSGAAAAQAMRPPAGVSQFAGDGDGDGPGGGRGRGPEGHGGAGVLGVLKDLVQIALVTVLIALLGWGIRSSGRRRMDPVTDPA